MGRGALSLQNEDVTLQDGWEQSSGVKVWCTRKGLGHGVGESEAGVVVPQA